jgi:hypothetical protein
VSVNCAGRNSSPRIIGSGGATTVDFSVAAPNARNGAHNQAQIILCRIMLKDPNQHGKTRRCILLAMPQTVPAAARGRKAYSRCKQSGRAECNDASKKFRPHSRGRGPSFLAGEFCRRPQCLREGRGFLFSQPNLEENAVRKTARSFARYWLEDCGRPPLEQKPLFAFTFVKFQDNSTR